MNLQCTDLTSQDEKTKKRNKKLAKEAKAAKRAAKHAAEHGDDHEEIAEEDPDAVEKEILGNLNREKAEAAAATGAEPQSTAGIVHRQPMAASVEEEDDE